MRIAHRRVRFQTSDPMQYPGGATAPGAADRSSRRADAAASPAYDPVLLHTQRAKGTCELSG